MKDIRSLTVRQFRIFPPDVIPYRALRTGPGMEVINRRFQFRDSHADPTGELVFGAGMFVKEAAEGGGIVSVGVVQINERRIIVEVDGTSADATEVYEGLRQLVFSSESPVESMEPVILTEETQCAVTLEFSWQDLFNTRLSEYVTSSFRNRLSKLHSARLNLVNLRFSFQFTPMDDLIRGFGVTLADKNLVIEPRGNYPLEAKRFFTVSPLGSNAHFEVLGEVETLLAQGKRRRLPPGTR